MAVEVHMGLQLLNELSGLVRIAQVLDLKALESRYRHPFALLPASFRA
jgi:hypothetical protein